MEPGKGFEPSGTGFILVALLLSAVLLVDKPFQGSRPGQGGSIVDSPISGGKVPSRLWQDPFDAILSGQNNIGKETAPEGALCKDPTEGLFKNRKRAAHVIIVMVPGGPYAEDRETRLRARYAVLSSLGVAAYAPEDGTHIRCMQPKGPGNAITDVIPYEWFQSDSEENKKDILVLWLRDGHTGDEAPLHQLAHLVSLLRAPLTLGPLTLNKTEPEFTILGPNGSGTLLKMREELTTQPDGLELLKETRILSPTATVDEALLGTNVQPDKSFEELYKEQVPDGEFHRTILPDQDITDAILVELQLRGINIVPANRSYQERLLYRTTEAIFSSDMCSCYDQHRDHVVLISEWDSFYGRSLPRAFRNSVSHLANPDNTAIPSCSTPAEKIDHEWIHSFNYMRGLDGNIPANLSVGKSNSGTTVNSSKTVAEKPEERIQRATGTRRFDYLRRLSENIERLDHSLRKNYCGSIKAVGILGSDVYDKLLILQALRERFPNTLFFTVDMDARYLHPAEYPWARNLIVGTSFGLRPKGRDAKIIVPPFRDSYQTARFTAVQIALNPMDLIHEPDPRIYEIGRGFALDLTVQGKDDHSSMISDRFHAENGLFTTIGLFFFLLLFSFIVGYHTLRYFGYYPQETLARLQGLFTKKETDRQPHTSGQEMAGEQGLILIDSIFLLWAAALVWGLIDLKFLLIAGVVACLAITTGWADLKYPGNKRLPVLAGFKNKTISFLEIRSVSNAAWLLLLLSILMLQYSSIMLPCPVEIFPDGTTLITGFTLVIFVLSVLLLVLAGLDATGRNGIPNYFSSWSNIAFATHFITGLSLFGLVYHYRTDVSRIFSTLTQDNKGNLALIVLLTMVAAAVIWHYLLSKPHQASTTGNGKLAATAMLASPVILITVTIITLVSVNDHYGEPFSLFYGVSMWPGEIIHILTGLVSIVYLLIGWKMLGESDRNISRSYFPDRKYDDLYDNDPDKLKALDRIRAAWCHTDKPVELTRRSPALQHEPSPELWWAYYDRFRSLGERWRSVLFPALLFFLLGCIAIYWLDDLHIPFRGEFIYRLDYVLVFGFMVPLFLLQLFSVVDETSLCVGWILRTTYDSPDKDGKYSYYLSDSVNKSGSDYYLDQVVKHENDRPHQQDNSNEIWLRLQIIAKRSHQVGSLISGPFVVLFLILIAQSPYFDNWDVPPGLIMMIILSALYAIGCAIKLRKVSENARQSAIQALNRELMGKGGSDKRIESILREVKELKSGGFLPWSHQPWLKAALWLLSSIGIMSAQYISLGMF